MGIAECVTGAMIEQRVHHLRIVGETPQEEHVGLAIDAKCGGS